MRFLKTLWQCVYYPVRVAEFILATIVLGMMLSATFAYFRFDYAEKESILNYAIAWPFDRTEWSGKYTQNHFKSIFTGLKREQVFETLGDPLEKQIYTKGETWHYACAKVEGGCRYFSKPYHRRDISFNAAGTVQHIWYEYWID